MLIFLLLLPNIIRTATDFENARISGIPRLVCTKKSITVHFETNIPFQGRISVMKKMYIPDCNQDYSTSIQRNVSFKMDIGRCTETTYMTNGSRVLTAHLEIGFHPLVITSSDRVYSVQCIDNSYAIIRNRASTHSQSNCSHVIRTASKWEGITVFRVGDAVVHEWNCALEPKEMGLTQVFLTSCNAISQGGQVIHLVDENGCVVDSELMGELVYSAYVPKIYARAKIFKLMNGDRYRIECNLQMCKKEGTCQNRPYPPKCAFSKDEILNRHENKEKNPDNALMTGGINTRFERQVKVTSEWVTVHYNQYTNVDQLHERYFVTAVMNPNIVDKVVTTTSAGHFLMEISYRDPGKKFQTEKERTNDMVAVTNPVVTAPASFKPQISPVISSSEENQIETISEELAFVLPVAEVRKVSPLKTGPLPVPVQTSKFEARVSSTSTKGIRYSLSTERTTNTTMASKHATTTPKTTKNASTSSKLSSTMSSGDFKVKKITASASTVIFNRKSSLKGGVATMRFYTDNTPTTSSPTATSIPTTGMPFHEDNEIFTNTKNFVQTGSTIPSRPLDKNSFENPRDWRLDDRTINDTDIFSSDKQIACTNSSTMLSAKKCLWTGLDHLLIVWSFGSALVWVVMLAVCFYRNSRKRPDWVAYREQKMKRTNKARVLPQEHPWLHADAFEEPKLRKKHEIDMSKF